MAALMQRLALSSAKATSLGGAFATRLPQTTLLARPLATTTSLLPRRATIHASALNGAVSSAPEPCTLWPRGACMPPAKVPVGCKPWG